MEREYIDPLTGEAFVPKRSDQKFANRENQVRFNNNKAKEKRKAMATITKALDTNRNILQKLLQHTKSTSKSRDFLLGAGFHFGISTHKIEDSKGELWSCIYDYALRLTDDEKFEITKLKQGH